VMADTPSVGYLLVRPTAKTTTPRQMSDDKCLVNYRKVIKSVKQTAYSKRAGDGTPGMNDHSKCHSNPRKNLAISHQIFVGLPSSRYRHILAISSSIWNDSPGFRGYIQGRQDTFHDQLRLPFMTSR